MAVAVVLVAGGFWWSKHRQVNVAPVAAPASQTTNTSVSSETLSSFEKLKGRWQRPDGGYVLEIKSIAANGSLNAGYFNPKSIHVAQAEASREGNAMKVFVELRDVNYPGSTYTLTYDPASDQLKGVYYQAVEQQRFPVAFVRMK